VSLRAAAALLGIALPGQQLDCVRKIDGTGLAGGPVTVAEGVVRLEVSGQPQTLPLAQVVEIGPRPEHKSASAPVAVVAPAVLLRSGQWLAGGLELHGEREIEVQVHGGAGKALVPLRFVAAIRFQPRAAADDRGFLAATTELPDKDQLYALREREIVRLTVEVLGFERDRVKVLFGGEQQTIPIDKIYGLVMGRSSGVAPDPITGPRATVLSSGGAAVTGRLLVLDDERCTLALAEGPQLSFPRARVHKIRIASDALAFLSDLVPKVEQTPALDRTWPPMFDQAPAGGLIKLGGKEHSRGIVLVPRTRLRYALEGRFQWFAAIVGLEDRSGPQAHAVLRVVADGKVVFDSGEVTPGAEPRDVKLEVLGVKELVLEADFGKNLDLGDQCVFASARVWKEG
jgi:hypothetical protein